jgi:hypothetical protein
MNLLQVLDKDKRFARVVYAGGRGRSSEEKHTAGITISAFIISRW